MGVLGKAAAGLLALLCAPVHASRTKAVELQLQTEAEELDSSKPRCSQTEATVDFNGFTVAFDILQGKKVGGLVTVKCGPTTGTPDEEVGFECVDDADGVHYKKYFGFCKSIEQVKEENMPKCPKIEFKAEWTVDSKPVAMKFMLDETKQPDGVDIPVVVPCPPGSTAPDKSASFICRANATWAPVIDATKACLDLEGSSVGVEEQTENGSGDEVALDADVEKGTLPCKLEVKHVPLEGGKDGFELLVTCTEAIEDAKIVKFQEGRDLSVSDIKPNVLTRILTLEIEDYLGKELVMVAKAGDEYKSTSVVVEAEKPLTPGSLPCILSKEAVMLTSNEEGFQVYLECKEPITDASLKIPGYAPLNFASVGKGRFQLTTQAVAAFEGETFVLVGRYGGSEESTNEITI